MLGYKIINLLDIEKTMGGECLEKIISDFSCPYNRDVEDFLHFKSKLFAKQGIASTFLVFSSYKEHAVLVGYFSLAQKFFHTDIKKGGALGSNLRRRISRFATFDNNIKKYMVTAPLIGQLGKNYNDGLDRLISGDELLELACEKVREAQKILGGKVVYLESEDIPALKEFYKRNGFHDFGIRRLDADEVSEMDNGYLIQYLKYLD